MMSADSQCRFAAGNLVSILLPLPLGATYDYTVPYGLTLATGDFVRVPLAGRITSGVVWGPGEGSIDPAKLKDVAARHHCPPLPEVSRRFVEWVSRYTLQMPGAVLKMAMSVPDALEPPKPRIAYTLGPSDNNLRITPARRRVLDITATGPPRTAAELAREAGVSISVIKSLAGNNALMTVALADSLIAPKPDPDHPGPTLSSEQTAAADALIQTVTTKTFAVTLVDGVPGAGKTEVYFQAIVEALRQGRQVLVLLPEIALSAQWLDRFQRRFGTRPIEWHSDLTHGQRRVHWRAVGDCRAQVVVGPRSALFLPYPDLGLIIVDEEHDSAYKQEDGVIYNGRDMAVVRAQLGDIPIALVSATPSLETVVNAQQGRYSTVHLADRHGGAQLPEIGIIDMLKTPPGRGQWISPPLREAVANTLAAGEQSLLFLNRRGYAPLTLCRRCGHRFQCPHCSAWLVEHRLAARLQCHHCGFNMPPPDKCPECETAGSLTACGPGVERLTEEVALAFPNARTVIAASDNIYSPKAAARLVGQIEAHEIDIIIGTQLVAKGYHFPLLTLVGAIDADLGLQGGDLRASERTYQLLYQVSGRAGRGDKKGSVLLQSYMAQHPVILAVSGGDRDEFLDAEQAARRQVGMPPFGRLVALIVSGTNEAAVDEGARNLGRTAPQTDRLEVLGPAPAPLALLRGRHRQRFLLKARRGVNVQAAVRNWLNQARWPKKVRVQVDVDPYSFF